MLQLIGLALLAQGPEYYNPAKGTGCARVNAERMSEGIETDYWCVLSALPHDCWACCPSGLSSGLC